MKTIETTKHTPGPWKAQVIPGPYHQQIMTHPDCRQIALARHWPDMDGANTDIAIAETEANARLIAAAPDLLDALSMMYCAGFWSADTLATMPEYQRNAIEAARAAISKSEGVQ